MEPLGHGIVRVSGVGHVQPAVGVELEEIVPDGRVGTAFQQQADDLEMTARDRPVQPDPPEIGRDVGVDAVVEDQRTTSILPAAATIR
nr:hypothetical protein [Nonomuraea mesophila]